MASGVCICKQIVEYSIADLMGFPILYVCVYVCMCTYICMHVCVCTSMDVYMKL